MISWIINKLLSIKVRLKTALGTRIDMRGDASGRVENVPHGSVPLPFAQDPAGRLYVVISGASLHSRWAHKFLVVDCLGAVTYITPTTQTWTTRLLATSALVETLTPVALGVGHYYGTLDHSLYALSTWYYMEIQWTAHVGAPTQTLTQRFMLVP